MPLRFFLCLISGPAVEVARQPLSTQDIDKRLGVGLTNHAGHFSHFAHIHHCINQYTALAVIKSNALHQRGGMVQLLDLGTYPPPHSLVR